jgi:hypothetical protein
VRLKRAYKLYYYCPLLYRIPGIVVNIKHILQDRKEVQQALPLLSLIIQDFINKFVGE